MEPDAFIGRLEPCSAARDALTVEFAATMFDTAPIPG
jgi:hypothetical protein